MAEYFPMPEGYRCPLCPDHEDENFCWDPLLSNPICQGCSHEIINLVSDAKRIDDPALDELEAVTGLCYEELQVAVLSPEIRRKQKILISPEQAARHQNCPQMTLEEWIASEKQVLTRFRRLVTLAKARIRSKTKKKRSHARFTIVTR